MPLSSAFKVPFRVRLSFALCFPPPLLLLDVCTFPEMSSPFPSVFKFSSALRLNFHLDKALVRTYLAALGMTSLSLLVMSVFLLSTPRPRLDSVIVERVNLFAG